MEIYLPSHSISKRSRLSHFFAPCSAYVKLPTTIFLCLSFHNAKLIYYELSRVYMNFYSSERMRFIHNKSPRQAGEEKKIGNNKILNLSRAKNMKENFQFFSALCIHSFSCDSFTVGKYEIVCMYVCLHGE